MPVTTRPDRVSLLLGADDPDHMTVVFCTYQSLGLIAEAQTSGSLFGAAPEFGLALCDEAHRTTGIEDASTRKKTPRGKPHPSPATKPARIRCDPSAPMVVIGGGQFTAAWSASSDNGNSTTSSFT